ncbi:uncharacterized protein LOC126898236 [Daktulosphaira vitifoliae]|uniref:uncharacterized protein LOC126898236 n=1 Tax=Daktulosphaira vitifoliae TaxID=58002 RepID=UPI0021A9801C|nr:uncharacterized protein LOC126898236 [Daktulosphaira vitifoliae]
MLFKTLAVILIVVADSLIEGDSRNQRQTYNGYYSSEYAKKPHETETYQDFSKIPGNPGIDYPIYHAVPETSFNCKNVPYAPGMYANVETGCQAYHICHDGREGHQGASFLCTNGTLFNQEKFTCDWWYNVDCSQASAYYNLNADPEKNPFAPAKPKLSEETYESSEIYNRPSFYRKSKY